MRNSSKNRKIFSSFGNYDISSEGGVFILEQIESELGLLKSVSDLIKDPRDPNLIDHTIADMIKQQVLAICLGYPDLNDHDNLRLDKLCKLALNKDKDLVSSQHYVVYVSCDRRFVISSNKVLVENS